MGKCTNFLDTFSLRARSTLFGYTASSAVREGRKLQSRNPLGVQPDVTASPSRNLGIMYTVYWQYTHDRSGLLRRPEVREQVDSRR